MVPLTHEPAVWRVWDFERPFGPRVPCRWSPLVPPPTPGLRRPWNSSVCLRPAGDLLSDALANDGHWAECDDLPLLYAIGSAHAGGGQVATAILDVGMNLGACTLHLLLATDAQARAPAPRVAAFAPAASHRWRVPPPLARASSTLPRSPTQVLSFEPGGGNLAHATSSLLALASHHPEVRSRSHVFPIGLGATNTSFWLHPALGNAGHSVLGRCARPQQRAASLGAAMDGRSPGAGRRRWRSASPGSTRRTSARQRRCSSAPATMCSGRVGARATCLLLGLR